MNYFDRKISPVQTPGDRRIHFHFFFSHFPSLTCMFHVLGRWYVPGELSCFCPWLNPALACFVCCIIWLIRSSCCFVSPSLPPPPPPGDELLLLQLATITGELGADEDAEDEAGEAEEDEGDDDEELERLVPSPLWKGTKVAPCGELASPVTRQQLQLVSDTVRWRVLRLTHRWPWPEIS